MSNLKLSLNCYPLRNFDFNEMVIAVLFQKFKETLTCDRDKTITDDLKRRTVSFFQECFQSIRVMKNGVTDHYDSFEELITLSEATCFNDQLRSLLKCLSEVFEVSSIIIDVYEKEYSKNTIDDHIKEFFNVDFLKFNICS